MALGFYFDMTRCVGCRACQVACKDRNNLDIGLLFRYAKTYETGSFPKVGMYNYSGSCNHCENPACVAACPAGALQKDPDTGIVLHDAVLITADQLRNHFSGQQHSEHNCDSTLLEIHVQEGCGQSSGPGAGSRDRDADEEQQLIAKYGPDLVKDLPILPDSKLTDPNTLIKAKPCALEEDFRELPT